MNRIDAKTADDVLAALRRWARGGSDGDALMSLSRQQVRILVDELSRLEQSNDRLRKQNRKVRAKVERLVGGAAGSEAVEDDAVKRVHLVHWNTAEAEARIDKLRAAGHAVDYAGADGQAVTRGLTASPPDVVVVDLGRLPAHGRGIATWLRERKALRGIPLVFVEGDPEKTARLQRDLPDAVFTSWGRIRSALKRALARPPADPVLLARPDYSGTPLPKKLGIKPGSTLALLGAPKNFTNTLGALPDDVTVRTTARGQADVIVLFATSKAALERRFPAAQKMMADGAGLWVAWPKQTSGVATDLAQGAVQAIGLGAGLVDNKVCAVDATWSGLRFARRRK